MTVQSPSGVSYCPEKNVPGSFWCVIPSHLLHYKMTAKNTTIPSEEFKAFLESIDVSRIYEFPARVKKMTQLSKWHPNCNGDDTSKDDMAQSWRRNEEIHK